MDYNASFSMNPNLIRVDNSCYRRMNGEFNGVIDNLTLDPKTGAISSRNYNEPGNRTEPKTPIKRYLMDDLEREDDLSTNDDMVDDLKLNDDEELVNEDQGFVLKMHLCKTMYGYIIGKRGQTKLNIENETRTSIKIPKENDKSNFVIVRGQNRSNVIKAFKRIRALEESFRLKQKPSHFVCIPLSFDSNIKKRFQEFKSSVLSDATNIAKRIDESVFQSEDRIHLTLCILYIGDSYEQKLAKKHLKNFHETFLQPLLVEEAKNEPILLEMKGLDIMNDDPSDVNVLYAKVNEVGERDLFKKIVNKIYDWFAESGLICEQERHLNEDWKVKIHATLMNIRYRLKDDEDSGSSNNHQQQSKIHNPKMDVSNILQKHKNYDFGIVTLNQIHISTINYYGQDQFYVPLASISL